MSRHPPASESSSRTPPSPAEAADLPVSLASISEAASDHESGKLIGFSQILWFAGIIGASVFGIVVSGMGQLGGQIMFAHVGIVSLVVLLLRVGVPESGTWSTANTERLAGGDTVRARSTGLKVLLGQVRFLVPFLALVAFYTLTNIGANTGGQFGTYIAVNVVGMTVQQQSLLGIVMLGVGMLGALVFMRLVYTPWRMRIQLVGAVLLAGSYLIPVLFGFSVIPWIAVVVAIGLACGWAGFRHSRFDAFSEEEKQHRSVASQRWGGREPHVVAGSCWPLTLALLEFSPRIAQQLLRRDVARTVGGDSAGRRVRCAEEPSSARPKLRSPHLPRSQGDAGSLGPAPDHVSRGMRGRPDQGLPEGRRSGRSWR